MGDTYVPYQFVEGTITTSPSPTAEAASADYGRSVGSDRAHTLKASGQIKQESTEQNKDPLTVAVINKEITSDEADAIERNVSYATINQFKAWCDDAVRHYNDAANAKPADTQQMKRFKTIIDLAVAYAEYKQATAANHNDKALLANKAQYAKTGGTNWFTGLFKSGAAESTKDYDTTIAKTYGYDKGDNVQLDINAILNKYDRSKVDGIVSTYNDVGAFLADKYLMSVMARDQATAEDAYNQFEDAYTHATDQLGDISLSAAHNLITYSFYNTLRNRTDAPPDDKRIAQNMLSSVDYNSLVRAVNVKDGITPSDRQHKVVLGSLSSLGGWLPNVRRR